MTLHEINELSNLISIKELPFVKDAILKLKCSLMGKNYF